MEGGKGRLEGLALGLQHKPVLSSGPDCHPEGPGERGERAQPRGAGSQGGWPRSMAVE